MIRTLLILLCSLVAWTTVARADGSVGVVVTGDATVQPQFAAQVEDWLRQRGNVLVPSPLPSEAINALLDCFVVEDLMCARKVVETKSRSPLMVFARIELADRDATITAYWFETGADPVAVHRACASCTDTAMRALTNEVMAALAGKGRADVGQIALTSKPTGAHVLIDGNDAGVTPLTKPLPTGPHAVTMSLPGHSNAVASVIIPQGETANLAVELTRVVPPRSKLPLVGLGVGGAALITGIVLYASSEDDTGDKFEYRDTRALGITVGVVGLAVVGVSAYFLLRGGSPAEGPTVAVVPGGAYVGWGRQF